MTLARPVEQASMQNEPIRRRCFVCDGAGGTTKFATDLDICGLGRVSYAVRCCEGCGLTLQDPAISPATMMRQYSLFSNYLAFDAGDPPLSSTGRRMLDFLARAQVGPGRVYDIGAAAGAMLWHFREHGWAVSGCDPSPAAVSQAKARYGIDLDIGTGEQTLARRAGLDLITLSHVLEHIYDPAAALRTFHPALADDGHLLFEVPCMTAPEVCPPGLFMMEHINYFEPNSLANLLKITGFEPVHQAVTLDFFPFPVVTILARKVEQDAGVRLSNSVAGNLDFLNRYDGIEQALWKGVDARILKSVDGGEEIYIWGAGLHTSTLLSRTSIEKHAKILAITDRDAQKHGQHLASHAVVEPQAALASGRKIVISSYVSEAAIAENLNRLGVAGDRIVRLYT
jgi:SAM-dependent methyltransferase